MTRSRILPLLIPILCAALMAGFVAVESAGAAGPARDRPARLPAPTGVHDVATRTLHLVDRNRPDPWATSPRHRHLMVTMTYPTRAASADRSAYLTPAESRALIDFQAGRGAPIPADLPRGVLAHTRTGASAGGPVLGRAPGLPLVVLSPGFSLPRSSLTSLATDLASRGYAVALVDHAHESSGTELPSGRVLGCAACEVEDYSTVAGGRVRDLRFVLDHLLAPGNGWRSVLDADRVAAAGHSIGGNSAVSWMLRDRRVDAAIDLDGTLFDPVRRDVRKPVMLMGTDSLHRPGGDDESWDETWERLVGERTWLSVAASNHGSFTDHPLLIEQLGLAPADPLPGDRAIEITRAHVAAFLDRHLRAREAPLLDGPSGAFPEVDHHAP